MNTANWLVWLQIVLALPTAIVAFLGLTERFPGISRKIGLLAALLLLIILGGIAVRGLWPSQQSQTPDTSTTIAQTQLKENSEPPRNTETDRSADNEGRTVSPAHDTTSTTPQNPVPPKKEGKAPPPSPPSPPPPPPPPGPFINIISPYDKQKVEKMPDIEGKVFSSGADVWIIVHPLEMDQYHVQPKATIKKSDGEEHEWYMEIFVGEPGKEDSGKHFEVMAVANPKKPLARGDVLDGWPEAEARSEIIELIRE